MLGLLMCITGTAGLIIVLAGILISKYPKDGYFLKLRNDISIEYITNLRVIKPVLDFLTRNKGGGIYRFSEKVISGAEANVSVRSLYLMKLLTLTAVAAVLLLVRYTNIGVIKTNIIYMSSDNTGLFQKSNVKNYTYNLSLYNSILKKVGIKTLNSLNNSRKVEAVKKVIPGIIQSNNSELIDEKAETFVRTYNQVGSVKLVDWEIILCIAASFWLPEMVLLIRRVLLGSKYKNEIIKLENVFELLGSVRGLKTINILDEMSKSSKLFSKRLIKCRDLFKTEKELGLESLKLSTGNSRLSRLVDTMRIYALTDKSLALQILERSKLEREEEMLLTAEEDIDIVDIIAFISIVPILMELANLLMKPMLDMIYEAFKYI